jgi:hypothetical protein
VTVIQLIPHSNGRDVNVHIRVERIGEPDQVQRVVYHGQPLEIQVFDDAPPQIGFPSDGG